MLVALTFFLYRILRRWSGGILGALAGRKRQLRGGTFWSVVGGLAQLAVVGAGPFAVWGLCAEGAPLVEWQPVVTVAAALWWLADAIDHHAVWWSRRDRMVVAQIGSGVGRIRREAWQLDRVFTPVAGGGLPPPDAPRDATPLPVRLTRRAENNLLNRTAASREWLAKVAADNGWVLEPAK